MADFPLDFPVGFTVTIIMIRLRPRANVESKSRRIHLK